jgi:hypothetical protein
MHSQVARLLRSFSCRLLPMVLVAAALPFLLPAVNARADLRPLTQTWKADDRAELKVGESRFGGDLRLRYIDMQNVDSLGYTGANLSRGAFRIRGRLSYERQIAGALKVVGRLVNESSRYTRCSECEGSFDEVVFDNLYLEAAEPRGIPFGIRVGRQDLLYGDGFVLADGTPLDGTRTSYVNGVLVTSAVPLWSFDAFAAWDPHREKYLPRINNSFTPLSETDDFLWGLLLRREPAPGTALRYTFEPYYIYKREKEGGRTATIHTLGTRLGLDFGGVGVTGEFGYQGGKVPQSEVSDSTLNLDQLPEGPQSISALGGEARIEVHLRRPARVDVSAGYVYLSGDDVLTRSKYEGWNPILGRWSQWSDLYAHALALESQGIGALTRPMKQGLAYWQNLSMPLVRIVYSPAEVMSFEASYIWLDAARPFPTEALLSHRETTGPKHRGELYAAKLSMNLPLLVSWQVIYEHFKPGSYYQPIFDNAVTPPDIAPVPREADYFRLELTRSF